jgi:hypothetical protein
MSGHQDPIIQVFTLCSKHGINWPVVRNVYIDVRINPIFLFAVRSNSELYAVSPSRDPHFTILRFTTDVPVGWFEIYLRLIEPVGVAFHSHQLVSVKEIFHSLQVTVVQFLQSWQGVCQGDRVSSIKIPIEEDVVIIFGCQMLVVDFLQALDSFFNFFFACARR